MEGDCGREPRRVPLKGEAEVVHSAWNIDYVQR